MSKKAYRLSKHAQEEAEQRGISIAILNQVMNTPDQIVDTHEDRQVYQSKIEMDGKLFLVRAVVAKTDPLTVVTIYRTTKIDKYWRESE